MSKVLRPAMLPRHLVVSLLECGHRDYLWGRQAGCQRWRTLMRIRLGTERGGGQRQPVGERLFIR
jgi:hypothetical protein